MKLALVVFALQGALACGLAAATRLDSNSLTWRQFKQQHGKVYATQEEDARRFTIFMANKHLIKSHNVDSSRSFDMGLNHMSDWTPEEKALLNGVQLPDDPLAVIANEDLARIVELDEVVPDEIDWRKKGGRVSAIKDQGRCGSCWAFSAIGLIEGQELAQKMSSLVPLSEQELVDCSRSNLGCWGGWISRALDDLGGHLGGIESEIDYPYVGDKHSFDPCRLNTTKFLPLEINGPKLLEKGNEKILKQVVANYGPVAVAFDASGEFFNYAGGIYDDHNCNKEKPNHAVLIVGYGKDSKKGDFWIVKNSWGSSWGEEGYFLVRAGENMCGIANFGTIVTFK